MSPLAIDLFCGLGGWTEGLLSEGYRVVGFDIERHAYGEAKYPAQLVIQDVLTLHGSQFKTAALIVASPPCQEYSYMAMPWTKAKQKAAEYRNGTRDVRHLTALFEACFRIQREASEAAGAHIPLVVENVRGAIPWVGRSRWNFGSFHLWGDVPALMPMTRKRSGVKVPTMGAGWYPPDHPKHVPGLAFNGHAERNRRTDVGNGARFTTRDCGIDRCSCLTTTCDCQSPDTNPALVSNECPIHNLYPLPSLTCPVHGEDNSIANAQEGRKQKGSGAAWWRGEIGSKSSKSSARKAASAHIAKIPLTLSRHIARAWHPRGM